MFARTTAIISSILVLLLFLSAAEALTAEQELKFSNVLPGGFAEKTLQIQSDDLKSYVAITVAGVAEDWIEISPANGYVSKDSPLNIAVTVKPPADAKPGTYAAYIVYDEPRQDAVTSYVGSPKTTSVTIEVTETQVLQARVNNMEVFSQGGKIIATADVENTGNVIIAPRIVLEIGGLSSQAQSGENILPTKSSIVRTELDASSLANNVYTAKVSAYLQDSLLRSDTMQVSLGKSASGKLLQFSAGEAEVGKPSQIKGVFQNSGSNEVLAQLKAIVRHDSNVDYVESQKIAVKPGGQANLTSYFTPQASGKYSIEGYVVFDSTATASQAIEVSVKQPVPLSFGLLPIAAFAALAVLLFFIIRARRFSTRRRK